ncbi:unnamed protein product, partial [Meganyctiphanes norvegica]
QCDKAFSYRNNLIIHQMSHTGEKPYQCNLCDKTFSCNKVLIIHRRTHLMVLDQHPHSVGSGVCKRARNEDDWITNRAKKARNLGQEYTSRMTGKVVKAREVGPDCRCTLKCFERVGIENINTIFTQYYASGDYNIQCAYIQSHTTEHEVMRRRGRDPKKHRKCWRKHHIEVDGEKISVCQKAFASFLGTDVKAIRRAVDKRTDTGVLIPDMRGKRGMQT